MKKQVAIATIIFACAALLALPKPVLAAKAGSIIKVEGDVVVQRSGKEKKVKGKFPLAYGDKVIVKSGYAMVLFDSGKKKKVTDSLKITKKAASGGSGSASKVDKSNKKNKSLKNKGGVGGAVRAAGDKKTVQILSVLPGSTVNTRPVFAWEPSEEASGSTVALVDEEGEEVWTAETTENVAAYPEDMDPLEMDMEYTLMVTSNLGDEQVESAATFYVYDEDTAEEIKATADEISTEYAEGDDVIIQHMLLGQYYKQNEMYSEAMDEFKKLVAMDPYDIDSYFEIADIHDKTGNNDALTKTVEKIQELEKELGLEDLPYAEEVEDEGAEE